MGTLCSALAAGTVLITLLDLLFISKTPFIKIIEIVKHNDVP